LPASDGVHTRPKERGVFRAESIVGPSIFVPTPIHAIELVKECRVDDVEFMGADADDRACAKSKSDTYAMILIRRRVVRTVLAMQFPNLKGVLSAENKVIVSFVPTRYGC
jgi:hypothetical protein